MLWPGADGKKISECKCDTIDLVTLKIVRCILCLLSTVASLMLYSV